MPTEMWSSLPRDILEIVADRLNSFADRVRVRAVCRWWRVAVSPTAATGQYVPPYLFFNDQVFCLVEKRSYYFPIMQENFGCRPIGSSNGWLAMVDVEADFYLFNPFFGDRIDLPPLWTIPDVQPVRYDYVEDAMVYRLKSDLSERRNQNPILVGVEHLCNFLIERFALSPNMTAAIIYRNNKKLAFASANSEDWSEIAVPAAFAQEGFRDVVYHDADGVFYAINRCGATISVDVVNEDVDTVVESNFRLRTRRGGPYLVSLPMGELLCLYIIFVQPGNIETLSFEVLKLVRETGRTAAWVNVENIDGWTLFFDPFNVWAQPSAAAVGYKGNCIYFAFGHKLVSNGKKTSFKDCGMFDIAGKTIYPIYGAQHEGFTAFWIQPQ